MSQKYQPSRINLILLVILSFLLTAYLLLFLSIKRQKFKSSEIEIPTTAQITLSPTALSVQVTANRSISLPIKETFAKVLRAIDGDTIEIEGGKKVRYIGINTPETVDPRRPVACFGKEAHEKNRELVEGKTVKLIKDVSEIDKYGRLLRYVYVNDLFVNDYLIREGFARVSTFPPDVSFSDHFLEAEREAMMNNRGLWKECPINKILNQKS